MNFKLNKIFNLYSQNTKQQSSTVIAQRPRVGLYPEDQKYNFGEYKNEINEEYNLPDNSKIIVKLTKYHEIESYIFLDPSGTETATIKYTYFTMTEDENDNIPPAYTETIFNDDNNITTETHYYPNGRIHYKALILLDGSQSVSHYDKNNNPDGEIKYYDKNRNKISSSLWKQRLVELPH